MTQHSTKDSGISLLIVLLVGTVMLLTSVSIGIYAKRMVSSLQARSDAVQTLYTAEQSFECVKYWLNDDYRQFGSSVPAGTPAECNGYEFDFYNFNDTALADGHSPSYVGGVGTFRIPFDPSDATKGGVVVEVERTNPTATKFDGLVRVYSQSNTPAGSKTGERFQEYEYFLLYGADIMFVVDRSGSINDNGADPADSIARRQDRALTVGSEWDDMLGALNDTMRLLNARIPAPYIGITSFGNDPTDTGSPTPECGAYCSESALNWRQPDTPLTDDITALIDDRGTPADTTDDMPEMETDPAPTNLSLGMGIGGLELMQKYYPFSGSGDPFALLGVPSGEGSGGFEKWVHGVGGVTLSDLPDIPGVARTSPFALDRPDADFPDVMIIITDGAPNGIMTHITGAWEWSTVDNEPDYLIPTAHTYQIGEAKLFRTPTDTTGWLIIDETNDVSSFATTSATVEYQYCSDEQSETPSSMFGGNVSYTNADGSVTTGNVTSLNDNEYPHYAMCNSTLVANKLKAEGITIIAILVADSALPTSAEKEAAAWMANYLVDSTDEGEPLLAVIDDYDDIREATLYLFEKLDLVQSR